MIRLCDQSLLKLNVRTKTERSISVHCLCCMNCCKQVPHCTWCNRLKANKTNCKQFDQLTTAATQPTPCALCHIVT